MDPQYDVWGQQATLEFWEGVAPQGALERQVPQEGEAAVAYHLSKILDLLSAYVLALACL